MLLRHARLPFRHAPMWYNTGAWRFRPGLGLGLEPSFLFNQLRRAVFTDEKGPNEAGALRACGDDPYMMLDNLKLGQCSPRMRG